MSQEGPARVGSKKTLVAPSKKLAVIAAFAALIAVTTFFSIPMPFPLGEITAAPAIYLALAVMTDTGTSVTATAIGSFLGEAMGVVTKGFSPIYPLGIVWARAPEAWIVGRVRKRGTRGIVVAMIVATVFETLAFFFPDWLFYTYGLFQYGSPTDLTTAFWAASFDFGTLVDMAFIPVALGIIRAAGPAFRRLGFE